MKISVVARNYRPLVDWLNHVCQVKGRKLIHRIDKVKVWHDDVLPILADHGDIRTVYEVKIADDCQAHIQDFTFVPRLAENNQYIVSRGLNFVEGVPVNAV